MRGATIVDEEGARIGKIEDIFLDRQTGQPAWAAVKTGLIGHRHTLVPIVDAFLNFSGGVARARRARGAGLSTGAGRLRTNHRGLALKIEDD